MSKFLSMLLVAGLSVFAIGCEEAGVEEPDTDTEIQDTEQLAPNDTDAEAQVEEEPATELPEN